MGWNLIYLFTIQYSVSVSQNNMSFKCKNSLNMIYSRHLVGSTNQACSSDFYFRIDWKSMEWPSFLWNCFLPFLRGLRSTNIKQVIITIHFNIKKVWGIFLIIEIRVIFAINTIFGGSRSFKLCFMRSKN